MVTILQFQIPLIFWDNSMIRYTGGSDIKADSGLELNDFTLQYIRNEIEEPSSENIVYVDSRNGID